MATVKLKGFRVMTLVPEKSCAVGDKTVLFKQVPGEFFPGGRRDARKALTAVLQKGKGEVAGVIVPDEETYTTQGTLPETAPAGDVPPADPPSDAKAPASADEPDPAPSGKK